MKYIETTMETYPNFNGSSPSSNSVASRLYARSRRSSFSSDPEPLIQLNNNEHELVDLATEVSNLSRRLNEVQEERASLNDDRARLRGDNAVLQERIHNLEEQYSIAEQRWEEKIREERTLGQERLARVQREKELEMENMAYKLQMFEKKFEGQKKDEKKLETELDDAHAKISRLKDELSEIKNLNQQLEKEKRELRVEYDEYRKEAEDHTLELADNVETLTQELNEFRKHQRLGYRQGSISENVVCLEEEMERVRSENREYREQLDELKAQLLQESLQCGQNLLASGPSLAAELNGLNSEEVGEELAKENTKLLKLLHEQEMVNEKLRSYIDNILSRVIEIYPEILEISQDSSTANKTIKSETPSNCSDIDSGNVSKASCSGAATPKAQLD